MQLSCLERRYYLNGLPITMEQARQVLKLMEDNRKADAVRERRRSASCERAA